MLVEVGGVWLWKVRLLPGDRVPPSSPSPPPFPFLLVELWRGLKEVWLCEWMPSLLGWLVLHSGGTEFRVSFQNIL